MRTPRKKSPGRKRTRPQREGDFPFIARLYVRGLSMRDIAAALSKERSYTLSHVTISKDIKQILVNWRESILDDVNEMRAAELVRINEIEKEAWDAWERSKEDAKKNVKEYVQGSCDVEKRTVEGQIGDSRFLATIQWCIDRRCKLFGLDSPAKIAPTTPDGLNPYEGASREQLHDLAAKLMEEKD